LDIIPGRGEASNPESRDSGFAAVAAPRNDAKKPLRQKRKFSFAFKLFLPVQSFQKKFSVSRLTQNSGISKTIPHPQRGAYRDRHGRWVRDAVDASRAERRTARLSGRRSRVVLTPRRWRQVGE